MKELISDSLERVWLKLSKVPGGKYIFSRFVGFYIPYTGSVKPVVQSITRGNVVVTMQDRRAVRNHLDSIHALALANLGEFTTGLAVISQLKNNAKGILVKLEIDYLKKARGDLKSEAFFQIPESFQSDTDFKVTAEVKNKYNEVVSKILATWRVRL